MKVKGAKQVHYESGPNMTPLVDVVMVILIFLMLTGSFGTSERFVQSKTPIHAAGGKMAAPPADFVPPQLLDVNVDTAGRAQISGAPNIVIDDPEVLRARLEGMREQFKGSGQSLDNIEVVLHPTPGTKWGKLAPFYDAALRAKYEKVSFAMAGG